MSASDPAAEHAGAERIETRARWARDATRAIQALYPFEPHFHDHGDVLQHYVDEGPEDGEALLFVHGNPTWSFAWRHAIQSLSDRYRCIAPDHVGCGLSEKPSDYPYRLARHVDNLERLVLELGLERITLVLHDWGGAIGMGFARRHPERIARIVLSNTAAFRSTRIPLRIAACRIPVLGRLAVQGGNGFAFAATFMAVERRLEPDVKRGFLLPYDSWRNRIATLAFVEDIPMRAEHPSWDELTRIEEALPSFSDRPVALLWGERDWCFTPAFREEWQAYLPNAEVTRFEDAGHYVFEDARERWVTRLCEFLEHHPLETESAAVPASSEHAEHLVHPVSRPDDRAGATLPAGTDA